MFLMDVQTRSSFTYFTFEDSGVPNWPGFNARYQHVKNFRGGKVYHSLKDGRITIKILPYQSIQIIAISHETDFK